MTKLGVSDLRPEVLAFAVRMEETLRLHDAEKGHRGWKGKEQCPFLWDGFLAEVRELVQASKRGPGDRFCAEAIDCANMLMMLVDNHDGLPLEMSTTFGSEVRTARIALRIKIADAGTGSGIGVGRWCDIENGRVVPAAEERMTMMGFLIRTAATPVV